MRAVLCCTLLAACAFEGAEGEPAQAPTSDTEPTVEPLPLGDGQLRGSIASTETDGFFGAGLLLPSVLEPPSTVLSANNPCFPQGTRQVQANRDRTFVFPKIAAGTYVLVVYRFTTDDKSSRIRRIERTLKTVTMPQQSDVGVIQLPGSLSAERSGEVVTWIAPGAVAAAAFGLSSKGSNACSSGLALQVSGAFEANAAGYSKIKAVIEDVSNRQMSIDLVDRKDD
jgi:hypothetical protein